MTESEWLTAAEPRMMMRFLRERGGTGLSKHMYNLEEEHLIPRRWRLLCCGCCWRLPNINFEDVAKIEIAERWADSKPEQLDWNLELDLWRELEQSGRYSAPNYMDARNLIGEVLGHVRDSICRSASRGHGNQAISILLRINQIEKTYQCRLLRDIFGNPFRPIQFDPAWLTPTVVALAQSIYADRAFDRMPILADALEEAGCDNVDLLLHCRGDGPHVRGCWVVDAVLGKE